MGCVNERTATLSATVDGNARPEGLGRVGAFLPQWSVAAKQFEDGVQTGSEVSPFLRVRAIDLATVKQSSRYILIAFYARLSRQPPEQYAASPMVRFQCPQCAGAVYLDNTLCVACGTSIGFAQDGMAMQMVGVDWQPCRNRQDFGVRTWLVRSAGTGQYCLACTLTSTIPELSESENHRRWACIEAAKRRLVYGCLALGIPVRPKQDAGDREGLEFRWLLPTAEAPVLTGQQEGVVTVNLAEADDDYREAARVQLGEPARTLLGHLRHELAHHLFERFVPGSSHEPGLVELFGASPPDYGLALQEHYRTGPPADWSERYISAYASAHPSEEWAETCAHYLLIADAVETATAWGLGLQSEGTAPTLITGTDMRSLVFDGWLPVARFLNVMARGLGLHDSYPYVINDLVAQKLEFVATVLRARAV